jgi:hypothetical protein
MKKLFLSVAALAFIATSMTSCKKDYDCECKWTDPTDNTTETYTYQLKDVKKKDAKDACNAAGNAWVLLGGTCDLK